MSDIVERLHQGIKPDQIPKEVVAAIQICTGMSDSAARGLAIIMLEQWPGVRNEQAVMTSEDDCLILPLPQEVGDVKANRA